VFVPSLPKAGGFTLTSTPSKALPSTKKHDDHHPFLELAVQRSTNPPAAWLWQNRKTILGSELKVRVGGSFTWPPAGWSAERARGIKKVIFVAGGVGINPLISMLSSMVEMPANMPSPSKIHFLYSTKDPSPAGGKNILFLPRLLKLANKHPSLIDMTVFLTNLADGKKVEDPESLGWYHDRRIEEADLQHALGADLGTRKDTVVYVCGPPHMTDKLVAWFRGQTGLDDEQVFCEKWW
jgi:ferredoxin-NADP reductase